MKPCLLTTAFVVGLCTGAASSATRAHENSVCSATTGPGCAEQRWHSLSPHEKSAITTICSWDPQLRGTDEPRIILDNAHDAREFWQSLGTNSRDRIHRFCNWMRASKVVLR
jgi:hypothetical protein